MRFLLSITFLILAYTISASPVHLKTRSDLRDGLSIAVCSYGVNEGFCSNHFLVETSAMQASENRGKNLEGCHRSTGLSIL